MTTGLESPCGWAIQRAGQVLRIQRVLSRLRWAKGSESDITRMRASYNVWVGCATKTTGKRVRLPMPPKIANGFKSTVAGGVGGGARLRSGLAVRTRRVRGRWR